MSHAEDLN